MHIYFAYTLHSHQPPLLHLNEYLLSIHTSLHINLLLYILMHSIISPTLPSHTHFTPHQPSPLHLNSYLLRIHTSLHINLLLYIWMHICFTYTLHSTSTTSSAFECISMQEKNTLKGNMQMQRIKPPPHHFLLCICQGPFTLRIKKNTEWV